ncbi:vitamin K epoxide reductase family protein [Nonomuraea soli]|uniref:Putative membrane protein n=1 Tax=Nonomuraea soli TaxID=1032476 RepID=A0A7W0HQN4_9ACTN|nr:vitamin K epoxide reductase family protein [Nonomuraea soli]MBA2891997.1 putative membrane protein [Nonomuraea soli]
MPHSTPEPYPRLLPRLLLIGGLAGLLASFVLTVEKIALLKDPTYTPTCSINPVLSCGSIMRTWQAELFGFPNPLLGVAGFAVVTTAGAALLAGARPSRWFWYGLQAGATAGLIFVHWLIYQSLYVIGALCPYCMVVWAVTVPIFWYVTLRNTRPMVYHTVPLAGWFLLIVTLIAIRFWPYWSGLL